MKKSFISLGGILLLITVNYFLFSRLTDTSYFEWYLKGGPLISLSVAFIALVWNDLDANEKLVSADPANFLSGCYWVVTVIFVSMATNIGRSLAPMSTDRPMPSIPRLFWDTIVSIVIYLVLFILSILWLLVVAPLMYFIYLVAGAPVRMGLLNPVLSTQVTIEDHTKVVKEVSSDKIEDKIEDKNSLDVSFTRKPVRLTATIAAILLWLAKLAVEFFSNGSIAT